MSTIVSIQNLSKVYATGHQALDNISLDIQAGEILALLGPNGAGKTTLISAICGIVAASSGSIHVDGFDNVTDYRQARSLIGLVPQELTLGAFESVWDTVNFSRGLFGKKTDAAYLQGLLEDLSLWDKKDNEIRTLSGGMKRRVLIAKALSHQPRILFLDEPTAGVDVSLRKNMWDTVRRLQASGVTIILTTHYIEEAEEVADRIGIINHGKLLLVEDKAKLMRNLGRKQLTIELRSAVGELPEVLKPFDLSLSEEGEQITYTYDTNAASTGITALLQAVQSSGLGLKDLHISQSSLEDIFVDLVKPSGEPEQ